MGHAGTEQAAEASGEAAALIEAIRALMPFCSKPVPILKVALAGLLNVPHGSHSVTHLVAPVGTEPERANGHDRDAGLILDDTPPSDRDLPQPAVPPPVRVLAAQPMAQPGPKPVRKATAVRPKRREAIEERLTATTWEALRTLVMGGMKMLGMTPAEVARAAGLSGAIAWRYLDNATPLGRPPTAKVGDALRRWVETTSKDGRLAEGGASAATFRRTTTVASTGAAAA